MRETFGNIDIYQTTERSVHAVTGWMLLSVVYR
jgi:hypothetical protein